jgi:hypothetical protein
MPSRETERIRYDSIQQNSVTFQDLASEDKDIKTTDTTTSTGTFHLKNMNLDYDTTEDFEKYTTIQKIIRMLTCGCYRPS